MFRPLIPLISLSLLAQSPAPAPMPPAGPRVHGLPQQPAAEVPEPGEGDAIAYLGARKVTYGDFSRWLKVMVGARAESLRKNPANGHLDVPDDDDDGLPRLPVKANKTSSPGSME